MSREVRRVEDEDGMRQARRRAQWELGDPSWAGVIVSAYLNPQADAARLREEAPDLYPAENQ